MSKVKLAHISPIACMETAHKHSQVNLVLAHLIDKLPAYTEFYKMSPKSTILDNGAFEFGRPYPPDELLRLAEKVNAEYIVLPDYPGKDYEETIKIAAQYIPIFKKAGYKTFFVPQSKEGDKKGYFEAWKWAIHNPDVDLIGCSILGAPTAFIDAPRLIARYEVLSKLANVYEGEGFLVKRVHMLGMLDTVHEICLTKPFHWMINSWDTSAAAWYGLHRQEVAKSYVKFERPVEFAVSAVTESTHNIVEKNLAYINSLR